MYHFGGICEEFQELTLARKQEVHLPLLSRQNPPEMNVESNEQP